MEEDSLIADQLHRHIKVWINLLKGLVDHMKSFILALVDRVVHHLLHGLLGHFPLVVLPVVLLLSSTCFVADRVAQGQGVDIVSSKLSALIIEEKVTHLSDQNVFDKILPK